MIASHRASVERVAADFTVLATAVNLPGWPPSA
jgi:hypothetical protein